MKRTLICFLTIIAMLASMTARVFAETEAPEEEAVQSEEQDLSESEENGESPDRETAPEVMAEPDPFRFGEDEGYAIVPLCAGGSCVDISLANGYIQVWQSNRTKNQIWKMCSYGDHYYFRSLYEDKILEVRSGKAEKGAEIWSASSFTGEDKQLWNIESAGDGSYYIKSVMNDGYVLEVNEGKSDNATRLYLYALSGGCNQRFRFVHVTTAENMDEWGSYRKDCAGSNWDFWDGSIDMDWYYANKNEMIYTIGSAKELAGLSQLVRDGIFDFAGRTVVLTRDLHLANIEWRRIGNPDRPFKGSFNGGGHAIIGLSITSSSDCDGLFGYVAGGCISNFAVEGSVTADYAAGGVVGQLSSGAIVNVYSEVDIPKATDDNCGGITGRLEYAGTIDHCTYKGTLSADSDQPSRGGIAGYAAGVVRYCVNRGTNQANGNHVGGIVGDLHGDGKIEYCANYGYITGAGATDDLGGICGRAIDNGFIFGCYNEGSVNRGSADEVGGILGKMEDDAKVACCINIGSVNGDDNVGGVVGNGYCRYSFNAGLVSGDDDVGSVSGDSNTTLHWCRALSWTSKRLRGSGSDTDHGAEWVTASEVTGGKLCYEINGRNDELDLWDYGPGYKEVFYQNIGGDALPGFHGQKVVWKNSSYGNSDADVRIEYDRCAGTVEGDVKANRPVTLTAYPYDGYMFDHFEVSESKIVTSEMYSGTHEYPSVTARKLMDPTLNLTNNLTKSYVVKAVFQRIEGTYELLGDLPDYISKSDEGSSTVGLLKEDGTIEEKGTYKKCSEAWEAAKKLGDQAIIRLDSLWVTNSRLYTNSGTITIDLNGYPLIRNLTKLVSNGEVIEVDPGATVNIIDSTPDRKNGYVFTGGVIQGGKSTNGGGLIHVDGTLNMQGGTLYNGGTKNVGGAIKCKGGTVNLDGVYIFGCWADKNSSSDNNGGAIAITNGGKVTLNNCSICNCYAYDRGGAIHMNDKNSVLTIRGTDISACTAKDNEGGAIYQDNGTLRYVGGSIRNCDARDDNGGAIYQNSGTLYLESVRFDSNHAHKSGGAIHVQTYDPTNIRKCVFVNNRCDDDGGAIYLEDNYLYMEDCTVTANASKDKGGGIYLEESGSIDICGVMVIKNNDGTGTMDNLVAEKGAWIYDQGLENGSEVHLRSTKNGEVKLTHEDNLVSEYQMKKFFVSDAEGGLKLTDQETVSTTFAASAFTGGKIVLLAGAALLLLAVISVGIVKVRRRKEAKR